MKSVRTMSCLLTILAFSTACGDADADGPVMGAADAGRATVTQDAGSIQCASGSTGGTGGASGSVPASFETVKLVFGGGGGIMPCAAASCHGVHGVAPPDHPLELPPSDEQKLYNNLLTYVSKACSNTKLVVPCNPAGSALVTILKGGCGTTPRMPYGCSTQAGDCIPDEYIAAVSQWIAQGAKR